MITLIIDCILFLCSASALSQMMGYSEKHKYPLQMKYRLMHVGFTYMMVLLFDIASYLTFGMKFGYLMHGFRQVMTIAFVSGLILACEDIIGVPKSLIVKFITFLNYSIIVLYLTDTIVTRGTLEMSEYGVYMPLTTAYHRFVYLSVYAVYIVMFTVFIVLCATSATKKRDKYKVFLLGISLGACGIGFISELMMAIFSTTVYKVSLVINFVSLVYLYKLSRYSRQIQVLKEDYEDVISPGRVDIVFVIDDELKVVFMNKRAEILGQIFHDEYYGRRINDIFSFTEENFQEIVNSKDRLPFGSSAEYTFANRHVNMVFEHKLDRFGELIASTVNVYNMEPKENAFNSEKPQIGSLTQNVDKLNEQVSAVSANARVLLIDENLAFLNEFQEMLNPFKVKITRAIGGSDAVERILNGEYDIIFVSDGMITMSAHDLCAKIRAFNGQYYQEVPIILVTSADMNEVYLQVLEAGFSDFLYKPIDSSKLGELLMGWAWKRVQKKI